MSNRRTLLQRFILIAAGLAFVGSTGFFLIEALSSSNQPSPEAAIAPAESDLAAQARGYELVLEREPNNPAALQGLADARIKMDDLEGAIAPLEKLVELYPEQIELQALLNAVKQRAELQPPEGEAEAE